MNASFYRAFEDRYRGSRELIKERQEVYLPFILPLKEIYSECPALDVGCGRGEWLEVLIDNGFKAQGIDLDDGMLEACHALNLPAEHGDALMVLQEMEDESQTVISGFHIAEHIPFEDLQRLVAQALRVLKPAGLMILETPNAENVVVGTNNFYLDPTHERPIPHLLLSFLAEHTGFARTKLLRLQEWAPLAKAENIGLFSVLSGASPDYAIVAQKAASKDMFAYFTQAFEKDYGLALDVLAERYDQGLNSQLRQLNEQLAINSARQETLLNEKLTASDARTEALLSEAFGRAIQAEVRQAAAETLNESLQRQQQQISSQALELNKHKQELELKLAESQRQLNESLANAHHWWLQTGSRDEQIQALLKSTSWQITKPLRLLSSTFRFPSGGLFEPIKALIRPPMLITARFIAARPGLKRRLASYARRFPNVFQRLKRFGYHHGVLQTPSRPTPVKREVSSFTAYKSEPRSSSDISLKNTNLSAHFNNEAIERVKILISGKD
ncbi:class I SAM-dependent methyltransferase [Pseudomonas sp.]|uniref:class I SAM-dependent methyltransferase n=1 Tax=Pseudomonas sp. TaxID=306 RepID=UPI0028B116BE|nr:class I SAM-dependent methyltransferase [Pseudomonas sp.]